jgi:hypothetical protein
MAPLASLLAPALARGAPALDIARPRTLPAPAAPLPPGPGDGAETLVAQLIGACPTLVYQDLLPNPYAHDSSLTCYADSHGSAYWIDHSRRLVLKVDTDPRPFAPARAIAAEARRPIPELRSLALAIAHRAEPRLGALIHRLHPFERRVSRDRVVFRWEAAVPSTSVGHVPVLQIALDVDGEVRGFLHTLAYWTGAR